jgi:hypothetical protein
MNPTEPRDRTQIESLTGSDYIPSESGMVKIAERLKKEHSGA